MDGVDLRAARKSAGLGLRELARKAQFSAAYLSDVELNRRRATKQIVAIYEALGTTNEKA